MSQNAEAEAFLARVASLPSGPGVSLDAVLQPSLDDEAVLRRLFTTNKAHSRLADIHVGLVDVFAAPAAARTTRARVVPDDDVLAANYILPLSDARRRKEGAPATVPDLDAFKKSWGIFTEGSLSQLTDWNNVVAAGGSVLACLSPLPDAAKASKRTMRKYFHEAAYPSSDVDLFLWGMTPEQAERKIVAIYEAVRDSVPWDVTCVRTKHTVSIHSQYPYRCIQIVLRLYRSPAEILAGFDVDAPCCAYDGARVWASPRALVAMMRQCNTVDVARRSPSYEVRLAKYAARDFEVYVPNLRRADVDPTIFERAITRIQGLARLLVLEKLAGPESRAQYLAERGTLRGRPTANTYRASRRARHYKGDLKSSLTGGGGGGLEMSDYDTVSLHVPYGPGWDAKRIEKLVFKTDLGINTPFNPKNKGRRLHRHPAFFGTMQECLDDCCGHCPEPRDEKEHELRDGEDKSCIRGRVAFIAEDPGRQTLSGSFNPISDGEWSEQAYTLPTARLFAAIAARDRPAVQALLAAGTREDVNRRDHVGRTALHVAVLADAADIACDLVDTGARMSARLVGGCSALHLAAQRGMAGVVRKMLERSAVNRERDEAEKAAKKAAAEADPERPSSEDDWSSEEAREDEDEGGDHKDDHGDDDGGRKERKDTKVGKTEDNPPVADADVDVLEDSADEPDILDLSVPDWDFGLTPLAHAIIAGAPDVIDVLLTAGADPKLPSKATPARPALHPLTLTTLTRDEARGAQIAVRLLAAGASSSVADESLLTLFHRIVLAGKVRIAAAVLRHDPNAKAVVGFPAWVTNVLTYPFVSAIAKGDYAMLAVLLAYGSKVTITPEDVARAEDMWSNKLWRTYQRSFESKVNLPLEIAMAARDEVVHLLAALGADVNADTRATSSFLPTSPDRLDLLAWTNRALAYYDAALAKIEDDKKFQDFSTALAAPTEDTWGAYRAYIRKMQLFLAQSTSMRMVPEMANPDRVGATKAYFEDVKATLIKHSAAPRPDGLSASNQATLANSRVGRAVGGGLLSQQQSGYDRHTNSMSSTEPVPLHLKAQYDELFEACWAGDNARIEELCLPRRKSAGSEVPIQISVHTSYATGLINTPLDVALHRRHWKTARLVLAIAAAQYKPDEPDDKSFDVKDLLPDDGVDSDADSDVSMEDDPKINFTDIAERPSAVHCQVSPTKMLQQANNWIVKGGKKLKHGSPIQKTIIQDDMEGFVQMCNLYNFVGHDLLAHDLVPTIMSNDRPEMLDEMIRRTGCGITAVLDAQLKADPAAPAAKDTEETIYLGLNVGGKKRRDLVTRGMPQKNASRSPELLIEAAKAGALNILDYLSGPRVLAAYRFYAASNSSERALYLRREQDLAGVLPKWLGWQLNALNESCLTAAIIANKLECIKKLFDIQPNLMMEAMNARIKFVGFNALLLAAHVSCDTAIFDFFLEKGCDPTERDKKGCNIYHVACASTSQNRRKFLDHIMKTLPAEQTHELLAQQSKDSEDTPAMVATKKGWSVSLSAMLEWGMRPSTLLVKNENGSTPLHVAVQQYHASLTKVILQYIPPEGLYVENGVGQTPLDIITQRYLTTRTGSSNIMPRMNVLPRPISGLGPHTHLLFQQETQVQKLKATLNDLMEDGKLVRNTKLANELLAFADRMESKLAAARPTKQPTNVTDGPVLDPPMPMPDLDATYAAICDAVAAVPGHRQLVHLLDVQKSVKVQLRSYQPAVDIRRAFEQKMKESDGFEPAIVDASENSMPVSQLSALTPKPPYRSILHHR